MDLSLNETQAMLRDMLRRLFERQDVGAAELAETGIFAALIVERDGGLDGGIVEATVIAEELGRAGRSDPFIESAVIASALIGRLGTEQQRQTWLPRIASRGTTIAFVDADHGLRCSSDGTLSGEAGVVPYGASCELLLVAAQSDGEAKLGVFLVDPTATGLRMTAFSSIDGARTASLRLDGVAAEMLSSDARSVLDEVIADALVTQSAERLGLMAALINATVLHLRTRTQFGSLLGDFQALQHRLADMFIGYELARSMTLKAALERKGAARQHGASAAKFLSARAARRISNEAIQMHGAMGMTEEMGLGKFVRRIRALEPRLGNPQWHLQRLAGF